MRKTKMYSLNIGISCLAVSLLAACSGNVTPENKTAVKDTVKTTVTVAKAKWDDPGRKRIMSRLNVVQIPVTANENHLFGAVKSVAYKDYKVSDKDGSKTLSDSGYNVYDKVGHLVDQNEYDAKGTAKWNCIYKYDDQNKATLWDFKFGKKSENSSTTFKYDDKGRKIEQDEAAADKARSRRLVYKYDDNGNVLEEAEYYGDKKVPWLTTYKYDSKGNQTEYVHRDETGRVLAKLTQQYDSSGNKTGGAYYTSDTVIKAKWTGTCDDKGRMTETVQYDKNGAVRSKAKVKYDDWDNIVESIAYKADGSIDSAGNCTYTEFEYDSKGNATRESWYKLAGGKKVLVEFTERKFEYYQ